MPFPSHSNVLAELPSHFMLPKQIECLVTACKRNNRDHGECALFHGNQWWTHICCLNEWYLRNHNYGYGNTSWRPPFVDVKYSALESHMHLLSESLFSPQPGATGCTSRAVVILRRLENAWGADFKIGKYHWIVAPTLKVPNSCSLLGSSLNNLSNRHRSRPLTRTM